MRTNANADAAAESQQSVYRSRANSNFTRHCAHPRRLLGTNAAGDASRRCALWDKWGGSNFYFVRQALNRKFLYARVLISLLQSLASGVKRDKSLFRGMEFENTRVRSVLIQNTDNNNIPDKISDIYETEFRLYQLFLSGFIGFFLNR